ncbi:MAG TPA: helix-turn-helix transcriptional regulator [Chloroflexota bacterium]|nr:helix-turn-helix transcriptional regulator [Chloroflexota bacterium]
MNNKFSHADLDPALMSGYARLALHSARTLTADAGTRGIGARVRDLRERRAWSRAQLAAKSGLGDIRIQLLEQGLLPENELSYQHVEALAGGLGVTVDDLLGKSAAGLAVRAGNRIEYVRGEVRGFLARLEGAWQWQPAAASAHPVMRGARRPVWVNMAPADPRLVLALGEDNSFLTVLLLRTEGDGYEEVARAELDAAGRAEIRIPTGSETLQVLLIAPDDPMSGDPPNV